MNQTLAIIKPDATGAGRAGKIIAHLEEKGFKVRAMRMTRLDQRQAEAFYAVHRERPFFDSLVSFMTSGPVIPMVLEKDGAVAAFREAIGATNPEEAAEGTVRKLWAESIERNAVHGSDSDENARQEIGFFFSDQDLLSI
ncbi:MAG: nucleoside-diphosphate kinase [Gemmatimonadales bacterium]|nr:MAG: nucleoside-diphosphate kinase [Gemmatimonadales bacterium]